jgi:putative ABC transport system permease protein
MTDSKRTSGLRFLLWLIRAIGVVVPRKLRADWRAEWEAELRNRETLLAEWQRLTWRAKADLARRSFGAFYDALWLQQLRLEDDMIKDLRYGGRMLLKTPGFTLLAVLTLALGIGASTAIFSAVNPILFESLPYPNAGRITTVWDTFQGARSAVTFGTYRELMERSRSFDGLAVIRPWQPTITGPAEPERLDGQRVSAGYFRVLGVPPAIGQGFSSSDDRPDGPRVVILSDRLWRRRFAGDHDIIGREIKLDDDSYTIVGVMPKTFENVLSASAEVWTTLRYDQSLPLQGKEWGHHLRMVGRLRAESGIAQARRELDFIAHTPLQEFPRPAWASLKDGVILNSLQDDVTRGVKPALLAVLGAVLLLLIIACVNVTNLLLARGAQRRGEFAVRAALGAGRIRMIRQLLTESLLLAVLGGSLGMVVAESGVRALVLLSPPGLPRMAAIGIDGTAFAFGMAITTLIGVAVGLIPALSASRGNLHIRLQQSSQRTTGGHQLTRRVLVIGEVSLALVLLVSAGLLLRSIERLFAVSPGFDATDVLTMQVQTSGHRFDDDTTHRFFAQTLEAVRQVPGVTSAGFTSQLPLSGDLDEYGVGFESSPNDDPEEDHSAFRYAVSPGYFEAIGIPLRSGRLLDARDRAGAPLVALVNESFAARKFPGVSPIGQRLRIGSNDSPPYTIVGVVGDVKQVSLALNQADAVYITTAQWRFADDALSLVVRGRVDAAALTPAIRKAIWSVDKDQPIVRVAMMDSLLAASAGERRFTLVLFEAFGLVALVLAATGIYGVLSVSVNERMREMGLRSALGASRGSLLALVIRQGLTFTAVGIAVGLCGTVPATRALEVLLFGVSRLDPSTYVSVVALLFGVSSFACWVPARRAAHVDPSILLRAE